MRVANGVSIMQDAMLINTADGMAATVLAGEPATIQFVSRSSTSVTFEAIREHMCAALLPLPHPAVARARRGLQTRRRFADVSSCSVDFRLDWT